MTLDHFLLGRYIADLYAASTLESRFKVYEKYVAELGFEGVSYTFAPRAHWEVFAQMPFIFLSLAISRNSITDFFSYVILSCSFYLGKWMNYPLTIDPDLCFLYSSIVFQIFPIICLLSFFKIFFCILETCTCEI